MYIYMIYLVFFVHFDLLLRNLGSNISTMSSMKNDVALIALSVLNYRPFNVFTNAKT